MLNQLFAGLPDEERRRMLADNCDRVENMGYMKPFDETELLVLKDNLADVDIKIDGIEQEKKDANDGYTAQLKPLKIQRKEILENYKNKAEYVNETCYVFIDDVEKKLGHYNAQGTLIHSRALRPGEYQKSIFSVVRPDNTKTGTND